MARTMKNPPNILWLMTDQHNANCLGVAGHPDARTPHLDGLANEGVRFERAYCNNPVCGPSRACFMSGQYPHTHGITGNDIFNYTATRPLCVPEVFRRAGYQTAIVGKGHLPKLWMEDGFETRRYSDLADAERNDPLSCHYFRYLVENGLGDLYDQCGLPASHPGARMRAFTSQIPLAHSLEVWTGDQSLEWLENRDRDEPFFLKISFQRPHDPFAPSPESAEMYDPAEIHLPESARDFFERKFAGKPQWMQDYVKGGVEGYPYRPHDEADLKRQIAAHLTILSVIDEQIGRVIEQLKASGDWENTVVVYVADHGDFAGEHGLCLKNFGIYESIHRIPFLFKFPDGPQGLVSDEIIESVDFYPTLCDAANLPTPAAVEGRSLLQLLAGAAPSLAATVCEHDFPQPAQATIIAARDHRFRLNFYLAAPDDGEFYDHHTDAGELDNLYHEPSLSAQRERLMRVALGHVAQFHRNWRFQYDADREKVGAPGLTNLLHKGKAKWSDIEGYFEG